MMDTGDDMMIDGEEVPLTKLDKGKQRATVQDDESIEDGDVLMEKGVEVRYFLASPALPSNHSRKYRSAEENCLRDKANVNI